LSFIALYENSQPFLSEQGTEIAVTVPDCSFTIGWLKLHVAECHGKTIDGLFSSDEECLKDDLPICAVDDSRCVATEQIAEVVLSESSYGTSCTDSQFNEFLSITSIQRSNGACQL